MAIVTQIGQGRSRCLVCGGPLLADDMYPDSVRCLHCGRWRSRDGRHGTMLPHHVMRECEEWAA